MRRYWQLFKAYFRIGLMSELEYRANFYVQLLESVLTLLVALGSLFVLYAHTDTLAGWLPAQLLALVGIHTLVGGLVRLLISPSMQRFLEDVRRGTLDFVLVKPIDAQFHVSVRRFEIWKIIDVGAGLIVLTVATARLGGTVGPVDALGFLVGLSAGTVMIYSFWMTLATIAFWAIRIDNIFEIFNALFAAGRWPVTIFPSWLRLLLTFVVPIAFAITVPAEGLTGRMTGGTLLLAIAIAAAALVGSRAFWRFGVRHYSGASA